MTNTGIINILVGGTKVLNKEDEKTIEKIQDKLTEIKYSKGAILFPHKKELPLALFDYILKEVFI